MIEERAMTSTNGIGLVEFWSFGCRHGRSRSRRHSISPVHVVSLSMLFALSAAAASKSSGALVDFNREIRPIFSENCFKCHCLYEHERKANLSFDRKEDAFKAAKSGNFAIVPGEPGKSKLIER